MDYEKNECPYDVCQLLIGHKVLLWAVDQDIRLHHNLHTQTIIDTIDNVIMNCVTKQLRIKKLEDYSTNELEQELNKRYYGQK